MPSGQGQSLLQRNTYLPENEETISQSVKEQREGADFCQLSQEIDVSSQAVTAHLERYKIRDPEDGSATYTENPYIWQPGQVNSIAPESSEFDPKMSESHLFISRTTESTKEQKFLRSEQIETVLRHYYPDHGSSLSDYLQEGMPEVQESFTMSYQTSTNGHGDGDASSNNSQTLVPVDNASLISRSTSQTKTQQVKTVTKIIKTREVHHVGPDGKPLTYPYGGTPEDFYYSNPTNVAHDYGTYEGRPPSPAGETPSHYGTYGRTASPATAGRNFDIYSPEIAQPPHTPYSEYRYTEYPEAVTTPSGAASDSPNLHRAMPQAPRTVNYEDIDAAALVPPPRMDFRTPSPTKSTYGPTYGYTLSATSPGYHQYDPGLPQGYLDRRPSYDEHPKGVQRTPQGQHASATYGRAPRPMGYEETLPLAGKVDGTHPVCAPPRHPHLDYAAVDSEGTDVRFRDPDLHEVIEFLAHPNNVVRSNAAAYLQHLCYMDDRTKQKTRSLGGILPLIELLNQDIPEIQKNACGALRNLSYGRQNDENKRAIRNAEGIPALVRLLRKTPDNEIRELVTGILWNLSSCDDLKRPIIDSALTVLVNHVIIPHSGYDKSRNPLDEIKKPHENYWPTVFRNGSGVLRNVSSAGEYARKKLRACEGLIESMVYLVRATVGTSDMDNKSIENCVCVLRNLSFRCQEVEDPDYDKHLFPPVRASAPIRAVGENLGCFSLKKKSLGAAVSEKERREGVPLTKNPISQSEPVGGMALLWQAEVVQCYLALLSGCSNPETLEAAAGCIQNLAACYWQPSIDIRACVRKEKGLPVLVELLKMEVDRVVCAAATALRNLAVDSRNKDLIGNYAMKDLVLKLPNGSPSHDAGISDDTIAAVLATLNEVIAKHSDFSRALLQLGGVERLCQITHTQQKDTYSPRVVKFASQLLFNMWQHQELKEAYRKAGFKESHFIPKFAVRNSLSSPTTANSTLNRPVSTVAGTKYEDTLPHGTELNSNAASIPYSRSEELPLSELSHNTEPPPPSQVHRPHMGVFPPGMQQARSPEPVYAQVKKKCGRGGQPTKRASDIPVELDGICVPAGDSWV